MTDTDKEIAEDLRCPFCDESEFDKYGLKLHLQLWCDEYKNLTIPKGVIVLASLDSRRKQKPITPLDREASLKVCRGIGRNISHRTWQKKDKWKVGG